MIADYLNQLKCRRVDSDGDMIFGADNSLVEGQEAMLQVLKTRLAAAEGEWWEGDDTAVPWYTEIVGFMAPEGRREEIDMMVIDRITDTVGVISVDDIQSSIENRRYTLECTVQTVYGEIPIEVSV